MPHREREIKKKKIERKKETLEKNFILNIFFRSIYCEKYNILLKNEYNKAKIQQILQEEL